MAKLRRRRQTPPPHLFCRVRRTRAHRSCISLAFNYSPARRFPRGAAGERGVRPGSARDGFMAPICSILSGQGRTRASGLVRACKPARFLPACRSWDGARVPGTTPNGKGVSLLAVTLRHIYFPYDAIPYHAQRDLAPALVGQRPSCVACSVAPASPTCSHRGTPIAPIPTSSSPLSQPHAGTRPPEPSLQRQERGYFPKHWHLREGEVMVKHSRGNGSVPVCTQPSLQTGVSAYSTPTPGEAQKYEGKGTSAATAFKMGRAVAVLGGGKRRGGKASFYYSLPPAGEAGNACPHN